MIILNGVTENLTAPLKSTQPYEKHITKGTFTTIKQTKKFTLKRRHWYNARFFPTNTGLQSFQLNESIETEVVSKCHSRLQR